MCPEMILLMVAATGEFIYLYFGVLASTAGFDSEKLNMMAEIERNQTTTQGQELASRATLFEICWITFVTNVLDIHQISIQTLLLILARVKEGSRVQWETGDARKKYFLKEILWYLCVCNFSKWVTDSFIEGRFLKESQVKDLVFGGETTWTAITQSTYPLVLFYRFHSVHMILGVMGKIF